MPADQFIFVGFPVDGTLEECLSVCAERDRVFRDDPTYLERVEVDGTSYIGKRADSGIQHDRLEDTARSVTSLLGRICGGTSLDPSEIRLIAIERTAAADEMI